MAARVRCAQTWAAIPSDWAFKFLRGHPEHWHSCARPPAHPDSCMCYCGERPQ
jgi:hypothetical protein